VVRAALESSAREGLAVSLQEIIASTGSTLPVA
jgi:hypothetical protein